MSLRIWLPLNGTLDNQGLDDVTIINNGAIIDSEGKIGSCYNFDGSDDKITITNLPNPESVSISMWFKRNTNTGTRQFLFTAWQGITLELDTSGGVVCSVYSNNTQTGYCRTSETITVDSGWTHICYIFENGIGTRLYINGVLKSSNSFTTPIKWATTSGNIGYFSTYFNGKVNDFRFYDHALSPLEVKQLSQGLILHYTLIEQEPALENLMPNSREMGLGSANPSTGTWRNAGSSSMTKSRVQITDSPIGTCYCFQNVGVQTPNDGSCYGIDAFPFEPNTIYTISMMARCVSGSGGKAGFNVYSSTLLGGSHATIEKNYYVTSLPSTGEWVKCWCVFKTNSATTRNIYIGIVTGDTEVTTQMCNVRIEKINYIDLGFNSNIIYDNSGYGNNGTINGILTYSDNTPKYIVSSSFNGSSNAIQTPSLKDMISDKTYTISCWTYKTTIGTKAYQTIYGGQSGFELEARSSSSTSPLFRIYNWGGGTTAYEFNKWYHFCFVHSETDSKLYINGELKLTGTSVAIPAGNFFIGAWKTATQQNYEGLMSDFRIYCTALSAEDVKNLYEETAYIDNKGNIYGAVLKEE